MGLTTSKEYAELEWPIDILLALVWVSYGIVFLGTVKIRKTYHIYVGNWFSMVFIITVGVLHIVNSLAIPVSAFKSYSVYLGYFVRWLGGADATKKSKMVVSYTDEQIDMAADEMNGKYEIDALVAYLQSLGKPIPNTPTSGNQP